MCKVIMNLKEDYSLDFAIYSLVMSKESSFSANDLVEEINGCQVVNTKRIQERVNFLMKKWVKLGIIQETFELYSVVA